jgi:hypothetical protein
MPAHIVGHIPNSWGRLNHSFTISDSNNVCASPSSGHIKPLLALFAHLAEHRSADALVLTLLSSGPMMPKIQRELELMSGDVSQRIKQVLFPNPTS